MISPNRVRGWLRALGRRALVEREMQAEMQEHLDRATERLIARGLTPNLARAQALREFGNVAYLQEEARDARGVRWLDDTRQDLRYAVRGLRRSPGFALAVIATLGLGVGANATMFGVVDRLLFRPPAYLIAPERAHHLYFTRILNGTETIGSAFPYQRFLDITRSATSMDVIAAYMSRRLAVGSDDGAQEVLVGAASASLWRLFDARPAIGRFFTADEDREPNGEHVAVLSYAYWQLRYGGSPAVLGKTIVITPARYTIVGVAPQNFVGVERETPSVFIPVTSAAVDDFGSQWPIEHGDYGTSWLELYGRRRTGMTPNAATTDLTAAFLVSYRKQLARWPQYTEPVEVARPRMLLSPMLAERGPRPSADGRVATWLFGVTAVVLLVACANVANLMLARSLSRRREIAVRLALGVSRGRLVRHMVLESFVLAAVGGLVGLFLAQYGGQLLRVFVLPRVEWPGVLHDGRTLVFMTVATVVVGLGACAVPLVQASRYELTSALRADARAGRGTRSRARAALILTQVALSTILLVGAGLFVRSVQQVVRLDIGYDVDRLVAIDVRLRTTQLDSAGQAALRRALVTRAEQNPLVERVSFACSIPFSGTCARPIFVAGVDSTNRFGEFVRQSASPTYFAVTGTRILRGRGIDSTDRATAPLVAVVSDAMAGALWPAQDAIGKCFRVGADTAPCRTVVGIAENVTQEKLGDTAGLQFYLPADQDGGGRGRLLVRVRGDAAAAADALRRDLTSVIPSSAYVVSRPLARIVGNVTRSWSLGAILFGVFGALALIVAAIGLYSVVAYDVAQRKHEVGVRIALGARIGHIVRLVVGGGLRVVVLGAALGIGVTVVAGRWLGPLLFRVSPRDPVVLVTVAVVLIGVALAASGVPALQASRVDPARSLRAD
jgi:predicted permease